MSDSPWWRHAVFYEIYVRSFADGTGDGVGDLPGIRSRLRYVADLGVDAIWLTPFYPSPMADHGYDVADPRGVEPLFGTQADFDGLVTDAHALGLRVVVDVVPNHSSDQHPWFQAALAAGPGSPERARYLFREGRGPDGAQPPNNWRSTFGGLAWTRVPDGQWYLHLFAPEQPDLNWRHPDVGDDYEQTLRFWLDRGVDGFRIDVAHGLLKDAELRDQPTGAGVDLFDTDAGVTQYAWDQPEVHEVYRRWRKVLDSYPGDRMAVGEVWVRDPVSLARYVRPDELQQAFNIPMLLTPWSASAFRELVDGSLRALADVAAPVTWVLSNHDVDRHVSRYGGGETGTRRARAALLLLLALPGSVYLYAGEELGLPEVDLPDEVRQDPIWRRSGYTERGRDGARVPLPWSGDAPPYGFCPPQTRPWLPMPADWGPLTVEAQQRDPGSMLALYHTALRLRAELTSVDGGVRWLDGPVDVLIFTRSDGLVCAVNFGSTPVSLPAGEVLLASTPDVRGGMLPGDAAAWVRPAESG